MGLTASQLLDRYGVTEAQMTAALDLQDGDVAYLSGSVADGLGTSGADLDVYVLATRASLAARRHAFATERAVQQRQQDFGIVYLSIGHTELDIEWHPLDKIIQLFDALDAMQPVSREGLWSSFRWLGNFERSHALEVLHRLRVSVPIADVAVYERLRKRFPETTFLQWNQLFNLMECEDFAKGTRRSLREDDPESALLKLRRYYDSLADAALFGAGESLDRWKWRLPKLRRLAQPDLLADYLSVQFNASARSGLPGFVNELLERGAARHAAMAEAYS
jgi:hypothetical protein